jgi:hypothetical protein
LGLDPLRVGRAFQKHCEQLFLKRGDQSIEDFLGICLDTWEVLGKKIPAVVAKAVAAFRERKRSALRGTPETRRKRTVITEEGRAMLEKAGGFIQ